MGDTETTGTPGAKQEGANANASGTPAASTDGGNAAGMSAEERAELERLRAAHQQALAEKETLERTKQENEWLRQQVEQASRATTPPTGYDPAAQQAARLAQALQNVQERDPEVVELLTATARMTQEQLQRQQAEQRFYRELGGIPPEDQAEVERIAKSENLWPSIAHDRVLARRYVKTKNDLAEQSRKIQQHESKLKRNVVDTTASPAPPVAKTDEITDEEHQRMIADAEGALRRRDHKAYADLKKKLDDVDYGRVRVRSG
jgi:hypothetical protein